VSSSQRRRLPVVLLLACALAGSGASAAPAPKTSSPKAGAPAKDSAPAEPAPAPAAAEPQPTAQPTAQSPTADSPASSPGGLFGEEATSSVRSSDLYGDRLDGIESEVNALKDRIFRSKARLAVLRDTVMNGVAAGSRVVLAHRNLMSVGFRLTRIVYTLDGAQIFARTDETGSLDAEDELLIFDGVLPPGPHELRVELSYQGQGYGVFSYLRGYTFKSPANHSFVVGEQGAMKLVSKGYERGNFTTEMKDRPAVEFQSVGLDGDGKAAPAQATGDAPK
jgi:hypothetical protein